MLSLDRGDRWAKKRVVHENYEKRMVRVRRVYAEVHKLFSSSCLWWDVTGPYGKKLPDVKDMDWEVFESWFLILGHNAA